MTSLTERGPTVVPPRRPSVPAALERFLLGVVVAYAAVFALSGFVDGLYELRLWGPVAAVSACLLIAVAMAAGFDLPRLGWVAVGGLAAVAALSAISLAWSDAIDLGWEGANRLAFGLVVLVTALVAIRSLRSARIVLAAIGIGTGAIGLYLLLRLASGHGSDLFVAFRLSDPVGYINGEAAFLGAGAWIWLSFAEGPQRIALRGASMSAAVALAGLGVLTQSRGGVLAWAAAAAVAVLAFPHRGRRIWALVVVGGGVAASLPWLLDVYAHRSGASITAAPPTASTRDAGIALALAAVAAGALYAGALALAARLPGSVLRRASAAGVVGLALALTVAGSVAIHDPAGSLERSWDQFTSLSSNAGGGQRFTTAGGYRYDYWRIALRDFSSAPLTGVGAGDYSADYLRERRNPDYVVHAHSLPLQLLAEVGVFGALGLALFIAAVLLAAIRLRRVADRRVLQCVVAATGVFVAWLLQSSVDWVATLPGLTGIALIAAALLIKAPRFGTARPEPASGNSAAVVVMLLALLLSASVSVQWLAERFGSHAQALAARDPAAAIQSANRSLALNPEALRPYVAKSAAYAHLDDYPSARRVLELASARQPRAYVPWALMGDLAARSGDFAEARRHYSRASRLNPYDESLTRLARRPDNSRETDGR